MTLVFPATSRKKTHLSMVYQRNTEKPKEKKKKNKKPIGRTKRSVDSLSTRSRASFGVWVDLLFIEIESSQDGFEKHITLFLRHYLGHMQPGKM